MTHATLADVIVLARGLAAIVPNERAALAKTRVDETRVADAFRRQTGRAHPDWGDGTLSAAVLLQGATASPCVMTRDFADCLRLALNAAAPLYRTA